MRKRLLIWTTVGLVASCGVSVHQTLVKRLEDKLPAHILENSEFIRAGAFYPDAFYGCMSGDEAAEAAHWPPFLAAGAELVNEKLRAGQDASQLQAFLVGVLSHQVADVSWHSLGIHQGLLRVMAETEFNGSYNDAHTALDVGGDMIQVHRLLSNGGDFGWLDDDWDYNIEDIRNILKRLGYSKSSFEINYCMTRGRTALNAEKRVASVAYNHYSKLSPTLYDNLEQYFIGGMVDMDTQTRECLPELLGWLENDSAPSESGSWDICHVFKGKIPGINSEEDDMMSDMTHDLYSSKLNMKVRNKQAVIPKRIQPYFDSFKSNAVDEILHTKKIDGEPNSLFGSSAVWFNNTWAVAAPNEGSIYLYNGSTLALTRVIHGPTKFPGKYHARFGAALAKIIVYGEEFLLATSPGLSRLDIFAANGTIQGSLVIPNATTEYGVEGIKLVGESLFVGKSTVYVGAPYSDENGIPQSGAVYLVTKEEIYRSFKHDEPVTIASPPLVGTTEYARFGSKLAGSGLYVLVGSPGEARVYGYDPLTHYLLLTLEGDPGTGFGGYLLDTKENYIAIGAPVHSEKQLQAGKVYIYHYTTRSILEGKNTHDWFGYSGKFVGDTLYVASPHSNSEQGALWNVTLSSLGFGYQINEMGRGPAPFSAAFGTFIAANETTILCGLPFYKGRGAVVAIPGPLIV